METHTPPGSHRLRVTAPTADVSRVSCSLPVLTPWRLHIQWARLLTQPSPCGCARSRTCLVWRGAAGRGQAAPCLWHSALSCHVLDPRTLQGDRDHVCGLDANTKVDPIHTTVLSHWVQKAGTEAALFAHFRDQQSEARWQSPPRRCPHRVLLCARMPSAPGGTLTCAVLAWCPALYLVHGR